MGNKGNKTTNTLPTMGEDVAGTIFESGFLDESPSGLPDDFDIEEHEGVLDQVDAMINDQIFAHNEDDFVGHEDDEQINTMIREQWEQARDMSEATRALLKQALDYDDEAVTYPPYAELAGKTYEQYLDSLKTLGNFMRDIPEL